MATIESDIDEARECEAQEVCEELEELLKETRENGGRDELEKQRKRELKRHYDDWKEEIARRWQVWNANGRMESKIAQYLGTYPSWEAVLAQDQAEREAEEAEDRRRKLKEEYHREREDERMFRTERAEEIARRRGAWIENGSKKAELENIADLPTWEDEIAKRKEQADAKIHKQDEEEQEDCDDDAEEDFGTWNCSQDVLNLLDHQWAKQTTLRQDIAKIISSQDALDKAVIAKQAKLECAWEASRFKTCHHIVACISTMLDGNPTELTDEYVEQTVEDIFDILAHICLAAGCDNNTEESILALLELLDDIVWELNKKVPDEPIHPERNFCKQLRGRMMLEWRRGQLGIIETAMIVAVERLSPESRRDLAQVVLMRPLREEREIARELEPFTVRFKRMFRRCSYGSKGFANADGAHKLLRLLHEWPSHNDRLLQAWPYLDGHLVPEDPSVDPTIALHLRRLEHVPHMVREMIYDAGDVNIDKQDREMHDMENRNRRWKRDEMENDLVEPFGNVQCLVDLGPRSRELGARPLIALVGSACVFFGMGKACLPEADAVDTTSPPAQPYVVHQLFKISIAIRKHLQRN